MYTIVLPVTIEVHEEGGYLAICEEIQGCHADGDTVDEALENITEVAEMIWDLCVEKNLPIPRLLGTYQPGTRIETRVVAP